MRNLIVKIITNQSTWDNFIYQNNPQNFFQLWLWGEVEKKLGTTILRLGLYKKQNLLGLSQLFVINARRGKYLQIRHGPVFGSIIKKLDIREWLEQIKKIALNNNYSFIRISPLVNPEEKNLWQELGFRPSTLHNMDAEVGLRIDLSRDEDKILSAMRKTTRNLIRKAEKSGVKVQFGASNKFLDSFLKLFYKNAKRKGFVSHQGIKEEFAVFAKENKALVFLAEYKREILSSALITFTKTQAIYRYGGRADILKNIPSSYLLQWAIIKEAKKRNLQYYNLWGISKEEDPSHPWHGFSQFKKGFGGEEYEYLHSLDLPLTKRYYLTNFFEQGIRVIRGYQKIGNFRSPSWLRNIFGV